MAAEAPRPPGKHEVTLALLEEGSLFIHLDPRRPGVRVPLTFRPQPQLVLQIGRTMAVPIPDLVVDGEGIRATLAFQRVPFLCVLPWGSIYALVGEDGRGGVWSEDVPAEVRAKMTHPASEEPPAAEAPPSPEGPPRELREWSAEVAGSVRVRRPLAARRAVTEMGGRRLVVDLRATTFGAVLEIALGEDAGAAGAKQGPYRGGAPARDAPRFAMRRRTTVGRILASLGIVREIASDDAGFAARVSVRCDGPAERVLAALARHALCDAAVDLFDCRFDAVDVAPPGSVVAARLPDPAPADLELDGLWHACRALARIADALEETGGA
jgi:stringent starvation protein B